MFFWETGVLGCKEILSVVRRGFSRIARVCGRETAISQMDVLMCGYAMFSLKNSSLLQFDQMYHDDKVGRNLKSVYEVEEVPSDTQMRARLDDIDPRELRGVYRDLFELVRKSNHLKAFEYIEGRFLLSIDGTEYFKSERVHCSQCCERNHRNGKKSYYHQMLCGTIVHPDQKVVIPLAPEPIMKADGSKKNDCERNASLRMLEDLKREHPELKVIIVGDGLFSNGPFMKRAVADGHGFLLVAKEGDHEALFEAFNGSEGLRHKIVEGRTTHSFRWVNGLPLNKTHPDFLVNVLEYVEECGKETQKRWVWVTHLHLTEKNVYRVMRGGRARHKIENETFNTLKNQGYQFEHNFGHGKKHLTTVFSHLMMIAFLADQILQMGCPLFKKALERSKSKKLLWERMRGIFISFFIRNIEDLWSALAYERNARLVFDSA